MVARRSSVIRSAAGLGFMPLASSFASTNASMGVFNHAFSVTVGTGGLLIGLSDQKLRWAAVNVPGSAAKSANVIAMQPSTNGAARTKKRFRKQ